MNGGTVHVIGAGLAGLSAAVRLADEGRRVALYEAAGSAGGRCRSYFDPALNLFIDNGNHLLLSGNRSALDYLDRIGGRAKLRESPSAAFEFVDLKTGERWRLSPNNGRIPWWLLDASRRVPGARLREYLAPLSAMRADEKASLGEVMSCEGVLYDRLWGPVLLSGLNTDPRESSARLAAAILRETLMQGGAACHPMVAAEGLAACFIEPALAHLARRGAEVRFGARLRAVTFADGRAAALEFAESRVELGRDDAVILAAPPSVTKEWLPEIDAPDEFRAIVNAHFRISPPTDQPSILGVVNGLCQWIFCYPEHLSVTISGADDLVDKPREALAQDIWREIADLFGLAPDMPPWQIVKEKRATFAATPKQDAKRPPALTVYENVVLAGDWTQTGLPATIEGAVRSGYKAAGIVSARRGGAEGSR